MRSFIVSSLMLLAAFAQAGSALAQHHHASHSGGAPHHVAAPAGPVGGGSAGSLSFGVGAQYNSYYNTYYNNSYWGSPGFLISGYGYGYNPYRYRTGWYGGGFGPYALPPVVLPAQTLFGPQPVQQMMGLNQGGGGGAVAGGGPIAAAGPVAGGGRGPILDPPADPAPKQHKVRVANAEAKARAGKFIDFGDALFAKQKFREALERYKLASQQAPDMAEIYLRQGIAAVTMGQYESAGRYYRRALKLDGWDSAHLRLNEMYGEHRIAKESHLEALAMAIQAAGHDANLLFVLGMEFYLDGQPDRAAPFFTRAGQLGGNDDHLLDGFIPPPAKPAMVPPLAAAGAAL